MKNYLIILILSSLCLKVVSQQTRFPEAEISNGLIKVHFYLPSEKEGYYQATRFDWSGLTTSLEYNGHNYYGQWFEKYSPTTHDAVMGPVEEFGPVGFTDAGKGDSFLKIGVGILTRPDESQYNSFKLYDIRNHGIWLVKTKPDQIQFIHSLKDAVYSYEYVKTIQLTKDKPQMTITHSFKNTGGKVIETSVYDHNFLVIDKQPVGPGYVVKFPSRITGNGKGFGTLAELKDNQLNYLKDLLKSESVYSAGLLGPDNNPPEYDLRVENTKSGAGVHITCDKPLLKLVFWCSSTTVCPEPYIQIKVEPGKEISWSITYDYYTFEPQK